MLIGFSTSIFVMLFLHAKEATAIGLSQTLFGKATLWPGSPGPSWIRS
ncbi:MAG: hypothetical protein KUA30_01005 [Candidatus Desulforudis sp.]|jgi:SSS family solute:Na+ symporter|nr:hypothetical protein [Desulforudis sp.]MBV1768803.1 hypothetical protein [Desulforudis sp.]